MMFYSIDLEGMRFLHKHSRFDIVSRLVDIEASGVPTLITSFASKGSLSDFTAFELRKLIANTTGKQPAGFLVSDLIRSVYLVVDSLPMTDCNAEEVIRQSDWIKRNDKAPYKYIKGSNKPGIQSFGLFPLTGELQERNIEYKDDPAIFTESERESRVSKPGRPRERQTSSQSVQRPIEGIALDIWSALDADESIRTGAAIQEVAKARGWQLMTAILQLAQWKKFHNQ